MAEWHALAAEIALWRKDGLHPLVWLRDDDAIDVTPSLERLLALPVPKALAVIPRDARPELKHRLAREQDTAVLIHGWSHENHAGPKQKKAELGDGLPLEVALGELSTARRRLEDWPGFLPVLVPPWNRIRAELVRELPGTGIRALSTYHERPAHHAAPGVLQVNTHVDPIDWHGTRGFIGDAMTLGALREHLQRKRLGLADPLEPTGILTHHLVMDGPSWDFLERLTRMPGLHWCQPHDVFAA